MIPFHVPYLSGNESKYIQQLLDAGEHFSGDGPFTQLCSDFIDTLTGSKSFLTTSCTHALEMAAILIGLEPGDEVIMSPFTFSSTANAFELRGAKIVFCDIRATDLNIDEQKIEALITSRTKAIVPMHYGGVGCDMQTINSIASKHDLYVVEDAAQCINSFHEGKHLGTFGDIGCISFHETKNIHCGEGGAILINNPELLERAEIVREKGTNRSKFLRGEIPFYEKVDIGSSYLLSELNAAFLWAQLQDLDKATSLRLKVWNEWYRYFSSLDYEGLRFSTNPEGHNGHIFWLIGNEHLIPEGVGALSHYRLLSQKPGLENALLGDNLKRISLNTEVLSILPQTTT